MIRINRIKLVLRSLIFLLGFGMYVFDRERLVSLFLYDFGGFRGYHVLWFLLMLEMVIVFVPRLNKYVGCGKVFARHYEPSNYNGLEGRDLEHMLMGYTKRSNRRAVKVAVAWCGLTAVIGIAYATGILDATRIYLCVAFFYLSDQICINVWCPFRALFIKNKCCVTCRIYNWGHIMMFAPLIFIPNVWNYSLVGFAVLILVQWEHYCNKYPERFSEVFNLKLRCAHCEDKEKCRRRKFTN